MENHPPGPPEGSQMAGPAPRNLGDISWVHGMFTWLGQQGIIPVFLVQILLFALGILVPASRGTRPTPEQEKDMKDLQDGWVKYCQDHGLVPDKTGRMVHNK